MAIQNNLAQYRQKRGLSAIKLAKEIGVSRQTIYAMETGTYVPNTVLALKLAQVLEVTVEDLFRLETAEVAGSHREPWNCCPGNRTPSRDCRCSCAMWTTGWSRYCRRRSPGACRRPMRF